MALSPVGTIQTGDEWVAETPAAIAPESAKTGKTTSRILPWTIAATAILLLIAGGAAARYLE